MRVAKVVEEEFGVSYHKSHVSRLLKELGWTPQMPIARAIQRDEQEIERWRAEAWPRLKVQACRERRALVFVDESGFYLLPGRVKTYAPEGQNRFVVKIPRALPWAFLFGPLGAAEKRNSKTRFRGPESGWPLPLLVQSFMS